MDLKNEDVLFLDDALPDPETFVEKWLLVYAAGGEVADVAEILSSIMGRDVSIKEVKAWHFQLCVAGIRLFDYRLETVRSMVSNRVFVEAWNSHEDVFEVADFLSLLTGAEIDTHLVSSRIENLRYWQDIYGEIRDDDDDGDDDDDDPDGTDSPCPELMLDQKGEAP